MTDYESALNTNLGDYLSLEASRRGISKVELEKLTNIEPIIVSAEKIISVDVRKKAIMQFNERARQFDAVLEVRENMVYVGIFGIGHEYVIRATGVKFRDK